MALAWGVLACDDPAPPEPPERAVTAETPPHRADRATEANTPAPQDAQAERVAPAALVLWHPLRGAEAETLGDVLARFERAHPGVTVEARWAAPEQAAALLVPGAGRADAPPDVVWTALERVPRLRALGLIRATRSARDQLSAHTLAVRPYVQHTPGGVFGYPVRARVIALFVHQAHLDALGAPPPSDTHALVRVGLRLTQDRSGHHGLHPAFDDAAVARHGLILPGDARNALPLLRAWGARTIAPEHGAVVLRGPRAVDALRFVRDLRGRYGVTPAWSMRDPTPAQAADLFAAGQASMLLATSDVLGELLESPSFARPGALRVVAPPRGPRGQGGSPVEGDAAVVTARTAHPDAAEALASWLASAEVQARWARAHRVVPTRTALCHDPALRADPHLSALADVALNGWTRAVFPRMDEQFDEFDAVLSQVRRGALSPAAAVERVALDWEALLQRPPQRP